MSSPLRILHVVTLVTPDGAFGGPVRVAVNHVRELRRRGHDAVLVAAATGYDGALPNHVEDVPAQLFAARRVAPLGFSGLVAPGMLRWVRAELPRTDVVHVHLARDLITLPVAELARRAGVRYAVQPHGMVDASHRRLAGVLDALATRRALRGATAVFHLTERERTDLEGVAGPGLPLVDLPNGTPEAPYVEPPARPDVLFLGRLHARKRPVAFVEAAALLLDGGLDATFSLTGPDEGEAAAVRAAIDRTGHAARIRHEGAVGPERTGARLDRASVMVLPSVDEPFPMSVLEALAHGRQVVVTDSCGLAPDIAVAGAGHVTDGTPAALATAVRSILDGDQRTHATRARTLAATRYSTPAVVDRWLAATRS